MTASRRVRLIIVLAVAFSFVGVVYAAIVYVPVTNSGFISDLSGWTLIQEGGTVEWSEGGYSDAGEALMTYGGGGAAIAWQSFDNFTTTTYTVSAWLSCTTIGEIGIGYWDPDMHSNFSGCSGSWNQCVTNYTIPSEIPSFEVYVGSEIPGVCEIDNVELSYDSIVEPTPEPTSLSPTAFGFMLGNSIYLSVGFLTFFSLLSVGMWISKVKIVGGIKQRDDD